jgi:hypothetical protein
MAQTVTRSAQAVHPNLAAARPEAFAAMAKRVTELALASTATQMLIAALFALEASPMCVTATEFATTVGAHATRRT